MARFDFKLDGVLHHRERVEKERQRELAVVLAVMVGLEAELRALQEQVQAATTDVKDNRLVGRLDMHYLAAHRRYMLGMQRKILSHARKMADQQKQVDAARRALGEASVQRKVLEKLRERHLQRWTASRAAREAGAMDELATQMSYSDLTSRSEETP